MSRNATAAGSYLSLTASSTAVAVSLVVREISTDSSALSTRGWFRSQFFCSGRLCAVRVGGNDSASLVRVRHQSLPGGYRLWGIELKGTTTVSQRKSREPLNVGKKKSTGVEATESAAKNVAGHEVQLEIGDMIAIAVMLIRIL
jgi:hypothetical protein